MSRKKKDDPEDRTHGVGPGRGIHSRLSPVIPAFATQSKASGGSREISYRERSPSSAVLVVLRFVTDRIFSLDSEWNQKLVFRLGITWLWRYTNSRRGTS